MTTVKSKGIAPSLQDLHVDKLKQAPNCPASFSFHGTSIMRKITHSHPCCTFYTTTFLTSVFNNYFLTKFQINIIYSPTY